MAAMVLFARFFDASRHQPLVDLVWLAAVALWVSVVLSVSHAPVCECRPRRGVVLPIACIIAAFAACWLPFYDNWRWAYTSDSISFYGVAYYLYHYGPHQNVLSVHGIDGFYTYVWELSYNWWVFVLGPSLFAHRFGMLVMACLALTAIYTFFNLVLSRFWSALIVVAVATNYVWLWFSYVSYLRMDSFVFTYTALALGALAWRRPDRLVTWMLLGLVAGLSLFYTPVAWSSIGLVCLTLGIFALISRRFDSAIVLGISFLVTATPVLLETPWLLSMLRQQAVEYGQSAVPDIAYIWRIFAQIVYSPYASPIVSMGARGAFLRWPLGWLYWGGLALAIAAVVPALQRRLRIPGIAAILLGVYLWDVLLLALTNKGYGVFSHKRTYNLLPLQIFFALLPALVLHTWAGDRVWARRACAALAAAAVLVSAGIGLRLMANPAPGELGVNVFDGLIELRQRFPERPVLLLTSREGLLPSFAPDGILQRAYGILDRLTIRMKFEEAAVEEACGAGGFVCYEPFPDQGRMAPLLENHGARLVRFQLLNSKELVCYTCSAEAATG